MYSLDGCCLPSSGAPIWPPLPWVWSVVASLIRILLISSRTATRSWAFAGVTGDTGDCGTTLTGVCAWAGSLLTWDGRLRFMGCCWPLDDGRVEGDCCG